MRILLPRARYVRQSRVDPGRWSGLARELRLVDPGVTASAAPVHVVHHVLIDGRRLPGIRHVEVSYDSTSRDATLVVMHVDSELSVVEMDLDTKRCSIDGIDFLVPRPEPHQTPWHQTTRTSWECPVWLSRIAFE